MKYPVLVYFIPTASVWWRPSHVLFPSPELEAVHPNVGQIICICFLLLTVVYKMSSLVCECSS